MRLLDLLFPPRCAGCRRYGAGLCEACIASIEPVTPVSLSGTPVIAAGRLAGPLQQAIHTYKYRGRAGLASELAVLLAGVVERERPAGMAALTFVPLHADRQRQRGYNQAQRLALELERRLGLPLSEGLVRTRSTPAQVGLSQAQRRDNLAGAFSWQGVLPAASGLGLVDDVCTTGATLEAAAEAIGGAGGSVAAYLVVARAQTLPATAVTFADQSAWP